MAVTKTPFLAKHGLTANEDSNFVKSVFIAGALTINGSASLKMPVGTTANRETGAAAVNGLFRYNSTTNNFEGLAAGDWVVLGGNQSVKSAAYQKIELISAAAGLGHEVIAGDNGMRIYRDVVGFSDNTSPGSLTGALVVKLPYAVDGFYRISMDINSYSGGGGGVGSIIFMGRFNGTNWTSNAAQIGGKLFPYSTIQSGVQDGLPVIVIGPTTASISRPQLLVREFTITKGGVANDWYKGWSITSSTDLSTISNLNTLTVYQTGQVYDSIIMPAGPALASLAAPAAATKGRAILVKADGSGIEYSGGYDATQTTAFTASRNMSYHLTTSITVTLPTTQPVGTYVTFTKSYSATPTIQSAGGASIKAGTKTDTSVTFDVNAQITFIFNGTDWEV